LATTLLQAMPKANVAKVSVEKARPRLIPKANVVKVSAEKARLNLKENAVKASVAEQPNALVDPVAS
ncbi:hypothetical protein OAB67_00790, partial [bacterium]|nr:hypothetical protein [bacterium]